MYSRRGVCSSKRLTASADRVGVKGRGPWGKGYQCSAKVDSWGGTYGWKGAESKINSNRDPEKREEEGGREREDWRLRGISSIHGQSKTARQFTRWIKSRGGHIHRKRNSRVKEREKESKGRQRGRRWDLEKKKRVGINTL